MKSRGRQPESYPCVINRTDYSVEPIAIPFASSSLAFITAKQYKMVYVNDMGDTPTLSLMQIPKPPNRLPNPPSRPSPYLLLPTHCHVQCLAPKGHSSWLALEACLLARTQVQSSSVPPASYAPCPPLAHGGVLPDGPRELQLFVVWMILT